MKKMETKKKMLCAAPIVLLVFACLITLPGLPLAVFATKYFSLYFFALIISIANFWLVFVAKLRLTRLDCCVLMFFIYLVANVQFPLPNIYDNKKLVVLSCSMSVFLYIRLYARSMTSKLVVMASLLSFCSINCILSLFQKIGYFATNNQSYDVTGTFFHPAPLAGILATVMPLCFFFSRFPGFQTAGMAKSHAKIFQYLAFLTISFTLMTIPLLRSRAATVALIFGCALFFCSLYRDRLEKMPRNLKRAGILAVSISLLLLAGALYMTRTASVRGRLLVWKITGTLIADKPLFGHGLDSFKSVYPKFQTDYFKEHIDNAREVLLSGEVTMAFNEILQLWSETGIVGLTILLAILGLIFKENPKHDFRDNSAALNLGIKASLLAFCTFSLFSYPFSIAELSLVFFVLLGLYDFPGGAGGKWLKPGKGTGLAIKMAAMALPVFVIFGAKPMMDQFAAYRDWYKAVNSKSMLTSEHYYEKAKDKLRENGVFVSNLAAFHIQKKEYEKAAGLLERKKGKTYDDLMALGDCRANLGLDDLAIDHYQTAYFLLPHKFAPLGKLLDLYIKLGKEGEAKMTADKILGKEIKLPSGKIRAIRERAALFNKSSEDNRGL